MSKYLQTNQAGYITGIVNEPLLVGLFGGRESLTVSDEEAEAIDSLLRAQRATGDGLHIRALDGLKKAKAGAQ